MRLLRTWPHRIPEGRSGWVEDSVERLVIRGYDARPLAELGDDILVLEWDIAVSKEGLASFARRARQNSHRVLVAPYRLYPEANRGLDRAIWSPRRMPGNVPVVLGDEHCHYFGFGMTYLPGHLLRRFAGEWLAANPAGNLTDETFSRWHYEQSGQPDVPIMWEVRPVHLHYNPAGLVT